MRFPVNTHRFDPYKNFRFRVIWDGKVVAGVSKVSALKRTCEVVKHREGGDPNTNRLSPGTWSFEPVTLERGVTHDRDFEAWANMVYRVDEAGTIKLKTFRKDIQLQLLNENGDVALSYTIHSCWVSEYQSMAELDAEANATLIELIKLENEGWQRDGAVPEPVEQ